MEQWTKPRVCVACGQTFSLRDHGTDEASRAARHLLERTLDPAALPPIVSRCPVCSGTKPAQAASAPQARPEKPPIDPLKEQQAVAAAMAIGEQMRRETDAQTYYFARNIGGAVAVLSMAGIALTVAYARLRTGFNPIGWQVLLLALTIAGAAVAVWAQRHRS